MIIRILTMLEKQEQRRQDRKSIGDNKVIPMGFNPESKGPGKYRTHKEEPGDHDWGKARGRMKVNSDPNLNVRLIDV